jgi:ABC-type spermidine/putrescine transport system permease subunit II
MHQAPLGLPQVVVGLANLIYFNLISFHNTNQVLVGLTRGAGGLAISLIVLHAPGACRAAARV